MHTKFSGVTRVVLLAIAVNLVACGGMKSDVTSQQGVPASASPTPAPVPKQITTADLGKLRWIEGSWRGTGGGIPPFYERYKFENDTTLMVEELADENMTKVNDVSRFELKDGHFGKNDGVSGSVATALDDNSVTFAPLGKATNAFRFQRESDNSWKAILTWRDKDGSAKERIYTMERLPDKKP